MKFLVSKDIHSNPNFTLLLGFFSLMMLLYFVGDLLYVAHFFGHTPELVITTLKGNIDEFVEPLSLVSLLEHLHISLFLALLAMFTTMAIVLRLKLHDRHKKIIILLSMTSLLIAFILLFGVYFLSSILVYGFMFFTILWHISGSYALILTLYQLWIKK